MLAKISINLPYTNYDIFIGDQLINKIGEKLIEYQGSPKCLIVTNPTVAALYLPAVKKSLVAAGFNCRICVIPDGERYKNLSYIEKIYRTALSWPIDRQTAILALGGGVIGDMAGFAAATILRGLPFVQIPTTLLAQVDSSVGGKVGVNHIQGKNMIGAFYQPRLVLTDINTLKTLPPREFKAGLVELIKYGMIKDAEFYTFLENNLSALLAQEPAVLHQAIIHSCEIKGQIVELDEKESGERAILNYGHTVGHALETYHHYRYYKHGEAVALGIITACKLAMQRGILAPEDGTRQINMMKKVIEGIKVLNINPEKIWELMQNDKKVFQGKLRMVLTTGIGKTVIINDIEKKEILQVLNMGLN